MIDRFDKRRALFVTQIIAMAQSFGLAAVAFMPEPSLAPLFVLAVIGGLTLAFDNPLRRSFVSEMAPSHLLPNAVALYSTVVNLSRIIGPALAGVLVITLGYGWTFTLDALTYLASLSCLFLMRPGELFRKLASNRTDRSFTDGIRYIRSSPALWIPLLMLVAIGTFAYNFTVTFPLFVSRSLGGTEQQYSLLYSTFSLGAVASALFIASRRQISIRDILRGATLLGGALILFGASPTLLVAFPMAFLVGVCSILYTTANTTNFQMEAVHEMHGRVLSLQSAVMIGSSAIGGPFLGSTMDWLGPRPMIIFGGLICLAAAAFGRSKSRDLRSADGVITLQSS
jgi:MFS family permease